MAGLFISLRKAVVPIFIFLVRWKRSYQMTIIATLFPVIILFPLLFSTSFDGFVLGHYFYSVVVERDMVSVKHKSGFDIILVVVDAVIEVENFSW